MFFPRYTFKFSNFYKTWNFSKNAALPLLLNRLSANSYQCKKKYCDSPKSSKKDEIPSTLSKFELFPEELTLDVEEERKKIISSEKVFDEFEGINLQRGITGVFDIEEIVNLLRKEKAEELVIIKIPPEYSYADYMVIVSGRSSRHMLVMIDFIRRIYKKKVGENSFIPAVEGKNSNTWMAIDLGNIILHIFSKSGREVYDLETLWTVGKDYDTLNQNKSPSPVGLMMDHTKILAGLIPKT